MKLQESLRILIREKLESGVLARNSIHRVWGGPGNGEICVACDTTIAQSQFVMEGIGEHLKALQFHVVCFSIWDSERRVRGGVEPGA